MIKYVYTVGSEMLKGCISICNTCRKKAKRVTDAAEQGCSGSNGQLAFYDFSEIAS